MGCIAHRKRAPSNFFFIRFWSVVRFEPPELTTFVDFVFSLEVGCVSIGFFKDFFTFCIFAFSTEEPFGGVAATGLLLFTTPSEESVGFLPLCFFFGGRLAESAWSRVPISLSRLTWADSSFSEDASEPCGRFRFFGFFEDDEGASSAETDQPGTSKSGEGMCD